MKELKREETIRMYLTFNLKEILREAKQDYINSARVDITEMEGMIRYAKATGDITDETYTRIYKLLRAIRVKYKIY